jgi:hypothetical protein
MMLSDLLSTVWTWLPEATAALRFGTASIGFGVAVTALVRRLRRRRARQRL